MSTDPENSDHWPPEENSPGSSGDYLDPESEEDLMRQIEEFLGNEDDLISVEISKRDFHFMSEFLNRMHVSGPTDDLEYINNLWLNLGRNPRLIQDFAYIVMDIKTTHELGYYPSSISMEDLNVYAGDIGKNPRIIRDNIGEKYALPNLARLGFPRELIVRNIRGEVDGRIAPAEATRFLGWLIGFPFMRNVYGRARSYAMEHGIERVKLATLGRAAHLEILDSIDRLQEIPYRAQYPLEVEAKPRQEEALNVLRGLSNLCSDLLLGGRSDE